MGKSLQTPFRDWLEKQRLKLHHKPGGGGTDSVSHPLPPTLHVKTSVDFIIVVIHVILAFTEAYRWLVIGHPCDAGLHRLGVKHKHKAHPTLYHNDLLKKRGCCMQGKG